MNLVGFFIGLLHLNFFCDCNLQRYGEKPSISTFPTIMSGASGAARPSETTFYNSFTVNSADVPFDSGFSRPKRSFGFLEAALGGGGGGHNYRGTPGGYYPSYSRSYSLGGLLTPLFNKIAYSDPYLYSRYRYYGPGVYSSLFASRGYGFHR